MAGGQGPSATFAVDVSRAETPSPKLWGPRSGSRDVTLHQPDAALAHEIGAALPQRFGVSVGGRGERSSTFMSDVRQTVHFVRPTSAVAGEQTAQAKTLATHCGSGASSTAPWSAPRVESDQPVHQKSVATSSGHQGVWGNERARGAFRCPRDDMSPETFRGVPCFFGW